MTENTSAAPADVVDPHPPHDARSTEVHPLRITSLDGLRGLAIFLVVLHHSYARWPNIVPWATYQQDFVLFKWGNLGVQLFFLISGFVIYLTLENCATLPQFLLKRWLRLFPAMLIATVMIYATAALLPERPLGRPQPLDALAGLIFVQPGLLSELFGVEIRALEGGFWTLFVEVKFYLMFGALFFLNRRAALYMLAAFFTLSMTLQAYFGVNPSPRAWQIVDIVFFKILAFHEMGWFASGAFLYRYMRSRKAAFLLLSALLLPFNLLMTIAPQIANIDAYCLGVTLYAVFVLALIHDRTARFFSTKLFVFFGFVSYPLYLLNENAFVALTVKTHRYLPSVPGVLTPLLGAVLVIATAWIIASYLEPRLRTFIRTSLPLGKS